MEMAIIQVTCGCISGAELRGISWVKTSTERRQEIYLKQFHFLLTAQ